MTTNLQREKMHRKDCDMLSNVGIPSAQKDESYCTCVKTPTHSLTETVSCKFCDCEYPDHSCRECHMDNTDIVCSKNQGLCNDCRAIQEGRL